MGIARILIWNLADSKTTLDEVREHISPLPNGAWISIDAAERFGLVAFGDLPDLGELRMLIGKDPEVAEEYDVEDPA